MTIIIHIFPRGFKIKTRQEKCNMRFLQNCLVIEQDEGVNFEDQLWLEKLASLSPPISTPRNSFFFQKQLCS